MRRSIYSAPKWRIIENKKRSQNPYKACYFLVLPAGRSKAGPLSIIEFLGWSPKRGLGSSQTTAWLSVPAWSEVSLCWLTYGRSSCVHQRLWRHSMAVNSSQVINFNGCLQSGRALICGASLALLHSSDTEDSSFMVSGPKLLTASSRFRFSLSQAGRERNFPGDLRFSRSFMDRKQHNSSWSKFAHIHQQLKPKKLFVSCEGFARKYCQAPVSSFFILFEKLRAAAITKPLSLVYDTPGVERSGIFAYMNGLLLRNAGKIIYCVDLGGCSDGKCARVKFGL